MKGLEAIVCQGSSDIVQIVSCCTREYRRTVRSGYPGCPAIYSCYFMEDTTGQKVALMSMDISREDKEPLLFKSEAKGCLIVSDRAETDKIIFDNSLSSLG